jgi:hypothetical protein
MDISFFKQFNPNTGKFHRVLPYAEEEHPRRIRGQVTDHELDQFRKERLKPRKTAGLDRSTNEIFRSLTTEELTVVREWADRVLQDAHIASSVLTDDVLNCSIRLLHKGGDASLDKCSPNRNTCAHSKCRVQSAEEERNWCPQQMLEISHRRHFDTW